MRLARLATLTCTLGVVLAAPAVAAEPLDLETLDGPTATAMMARGELTSVELTRQYIARIAALNKRGPGLNAVTQLNQNALKDAAALDKERREGRVRGPAHGLPVLLKDLIDVKGMYTSAGNFSLRDSFPETDSGIAKKLRENGVVILGKLGLSEYANSFGNQPSGFANLTGQVVHGLDADQNPSGSSSGSGTAGTAALSMLIVGTETGGSIIGPSQAQSLVGLRPTVGLVPGYGVAPIRLSADTAGPMDRTVANAALTLQSIAGKDPINDAYYAEYWGPGINPSDVVPPQPPTVPDYTTALDLDFVRGKRVGWNGTSDQVNQAKAALEAAGAILVERPVIDPPANLPPLATQGEQHMAIDMYYKRLGSSAPIKSLGEEIADNQANQHEALKFGNNSHLNAFNVPYGPGTEYTALFNANLPIRKAGLQGAINRMMTNDTPADTSDDFIAILGTVPSGAAAGFPQLTIPMGYNATHRRTQFVSVHGNAYSERNLIGVAYVIEQATKLRQPASLLNPSMYRCAKTIPAPPFASRGGCNPDYPSTMALVGGAAPSLDFSLETESAKSLQARLTAGTLSSETLVKAYLARIARTNAEGPAIQAVRALNTSAVTEAKALDAERASSGARGPLHGLPVLVDDFIDVSGLPTTAGSIALQTSMPSADAALVAKLKAAGAIVLGKTNVSELGGLFDANMPEGYSSLGGQVLLPSDTDKTVAGSAAGSAAATAAGLAALTVGLETSTDTAQMIAPAGVAGVVALKPTVGLVGGAGVFGIASSQDAVGPITRTVHDAATSLEALSGELLRRGALALAGGQEDRRDELDRGAVPDRRGGARGRRRDDDGQGRRDAVAEPAQHRGARVQARRRRVPRRPCRRGAVAAGDHRLQRRQPGRGPQVPAGPADLGGGAGHDGLRGRPGRRQGVQRGRDRRAAGRRLGRDHGPERRRAGRDRRPRGLSGSDRAGRLRHGRRGSQPDRRDVHRHRGRRGEAARRGLRVRAGHERPPGPELHQPEHVALRAGEHVLLAAPLPPGRPARRRAERADRDPGARRRRRHGAGDARADARVGGVVRRVHARRGALVHGDDERKRGLDRGRGDAQRVRPEPGERGQARQRHVLAPAGAEGERDQPAGLLAGRRHRRRQPDRAPELQRPGLQRPADADVHTGHRRQRRAPHGHVRQDADVHAQHRRPVETERGSDPYLSHAGQTLLRLMVGCVNEARAAHRERHELERAGALEQPLAGAERGPPRGVGAARRSARRPGTD